MAYDLHDRAQTMRTAAMRKARIRNQKGVTLLEVMVAGLILSVALLMLLNMAMVALDGNDWSNKTTLATQLMQEKLEQLRGDVSPASGSDTKSGINRVWTVSSAGAHLRRIDVNVDWKDVRNVTKTN